MTRKALETQTKAKTPTGVDGRDPNLAKIFRENGIEVDIVSDPKDIEEGRTEPLFMSLTRNRKKLEFDPGSANVTLFFDKKYKQVVVVVNEKARTIERTYTTPIWAYRHDSDRKIRDRAKQRIARGEGFPVRIPGEVEYEIKEYRATNLKEFKEDRPGHSRLLVNTTVVAHCKPLRVAFLVGWDEGAMFISCLPRVVKSVEAAHEVLRPRDVPKGSLRIGEFFFLPVGDQLVKNLDKRYIEQPRANTIEDSDNHTAAMLITYSNHEYARGLVWDDEDRHATVWLDRWHRVYRNTEVDPPRGVDAESVD